MKKLLILLLLTSCGKFLPSDVLRIDKPYKVKKTDKTFSFYVSKFEKEFKIKVRVPIVFESLKPFYSGVCYIWNDGYKQISINKEHWNSYNIEQREQLIYHELGHCIYELKHNDLMLKDCPASIMRSFMFSIFEIQECYNPNRKNYISNMFNSIAKE